ncbi:MAG TPA: PAS domain-containing sensor histidine kinase [Cyclobacteriaceae bacterium]|nr:PAS domain-containing sensor histidine kinase [Cyclobacteriaceae bacterium]
MISQFELSLVSNEAFREIFQSMTEGIIVVDKDGKILVVNPVAEKMFGYDLNELAGKSLESLLPARYRGQHHHLRGEFVSNPVPRRMGMGRDLAALRKNGTEFPVEISLNYSSASGNFIAMAFVTDITVRKKAEEALRQSEEQLILYASELEKKVEMRTSDLNVSIRSLEREITERKKAEEEVRRSLEKERELNELKSKFVSIASHEFRTPLSTILSSISLVDQYRERGEIEKIEKHIQRVKQSVNHLTAILNDFLSLGKLEEGKVEVHEESLTLEEFFSDVAEEMKAHLKEGQQIIIDTGGFNTVIHTDGRILHNILVNLLSNASKYSGHNKKIKLNSRELTGNLEINIQDEGIGIPESEHKHLFDRFFRATNAGNIQGTGLGLSIVKRYVELLGGTISFSSKFEKGSTFTFIIPLQYEKNTPH